MRGKKRLLANLMHTLGLTRLRGPKDALFVLGYHRVRPGRAHVPPFDDGVWGPDLEQFARHVRWLQARTTLLDQDGLLELLKSGRTDGGPYSLITFDDGYADNYRHAFPLLKELGASATFFIPSGQIEERRIGWWDLISYYLKRTKKRAVEVQGRSYPVSSGEERKAAIRALQQRLKLEPAAETQGLVAELPGACGVAEPSFEEQDRELMTWANIREMAENGMSIGSHTHSHTVLATLPLERQIWEMQTSRRILEEKTGRPVRSIAFPVGGLNHFTAETCRAARECGYELIYSFNTGYNRLGEGEMEHIRRFEPDDGLEMLAAGVVWPGKMVKKFISDISILKKY